MAIILFPSRCWRKRGRPSKASPKARPKVTMYALEYSAPPSASPRTEDRNSIDDAEIAEQVPVHVSSAPLFFRDLYAPGSESHS